ncbi:hypothetical protein POM88_006427 [Heracleum sosnowskyi]|uniref:Uncharacterized protein n=1 Tax=Heracleum sosnowskyi TaxID=360622 RepID=A0AAD8J2Q1_9APIA|nr:hypothetical protein POM88_006427 [Heracleum sosnowskyi]
MAKPKQVLVVFVRTSLKGQFSFFLVLLRELLEAQEKIKEIEVELVRLTGDLKDSELENTKLNEEVLLTKEKLEGSEKSYTELELNNKKLQQQILLLLLVFSSRRSDVRE